MTREWSRAVVLKSVSERQSAPPPHMNIHDGALKAHPPRQRTLRPVPFTALAETPALCPVRDKNRKYIRSGARGAAGLLWLSLLVSQRSLFGAARSVLGLSPNAAGRGAADCGKLPPGPPSPSPRLLHTPDLRQFSCPRG